MFFLLPKTTLREAKEAVNDSINICSDVLGKTTKIIGRKCKKYFGSDI